MPLASDGQGNFLALGQDGQWAPATRARNPETGAELVLDGAEWKPLPDAAAAQQRTEARQANSGVGGFIGGAKRAIEGGLTFGLRDEAQAAMDATVGSAVGALRGSPETWSDRYSQSLGRERARSADFQDQHPIASAAGNVVGGMATPLPGLRAAGAGAGWLAQALRSAPVRGAIAGAEGGAIAGFGEGEGGLANRIEGAATGGGLGAAGGAALSAGANVASRIGGRVLDVAGLRNPETAAERQILRALERDNRPLSDVAAEAAAPQGGAPLALADLGGRNTTSLAAVAANVPGRSMEAADALVQGRRAAGPDRMAAASDQAFGGGSGDDLAAQMDALGRRRSADAAPQYERANRIELQPDEFARVERFMADPIGQDALQRGLRVIELEHLARGDAFDPAAYGVTRGEGGQFVRTEEAAPNMRLMDAVKRGYDQIVEGFRDPTSGRLNLDQYGRAVNDVRGTYRNELADMFPPYRRALEAWSGPSQSMDAVNRGRQAFRTDRDVVNTATERLSPGDQDFYRLGAGRALSDMASDPAKAPGVARRMLEDRQMQARRESILPPDRNAALAEALRGEVRVNAGNAAYSPRAGSPTARLQAGMDDAQIDPPGGMVMALLNATQRGGVTGAAAKGLETLYRRGQGINSSTADALAKRLFSTDQAQNAAVVKALMSRRAGDTANEAGRRALMARILQGGGTATGLIAN